MSSKKIFAASLAAILATGSVASYAMAAEDEYTVVIDGTKAGKEYTKSATMTVNAGHWFGEFGSTLDQINATGGDFSKLSWSNIVGGLWEAYEYFNITDTQNLTLSANASGHAQKYTQDAFVLEVVDNKTTKVTYDAYKTVGYLPEIKDGKKLILRANIADAIPALTDPAGVRAAKVTAGDTVSIIGVLNADGTTTSITPLVVATADAEDAAKDVTTFVQKFANTKQDDLFATFVDHTEWISDGSATGGATAYAYASRFGVSPANVVAVTSTNDSKNLGSNWRNATNRPQTDGGVGGTWETGSLSEGKNLGPVTLSPKFEGLSDALRLVSVSGAWLHVYGDITVDGDTYDYYVADTYAVDGDPANWDKFVWSVGVGNFQDVYNGAVPYNHLGLGIVANAKNTSAYGAYVLPAQLAKDPTVEKDFKDLIIAEQGSLDLSYYGVVNPNVLKNLNNGGTVTFTLDKDLEKATLYGEVSYRGADGWHTIDADDSYEISGNEITFNFPANLTYHPELPDQWHAFNMSWRLKIRDNVFNMGNNIWANGDTDGDPNKDTHFDGKIVKVTFKANKEAAAAPSTSTSTPSVSGDSTSTPSTDSTNNGGNTTSNSGNTTTNPGSTSGNPNTGIALAVAPVVLAAGAVVTIVSKKRK